MNAVLYVWLNWNIILTAQSNNCPGGTTVSELRLSVH